MMSKKEIEQMNIAFDSNKQYVVAQVPKYYDSAEDFALGLVYSLKPYVAKKLNIEENKLVLVAISKNDKIVIISEDRRCRDWLARSFHPSCIGNAQFYDNVKSELILEEIKVLVS